MKSENPEPTQKTKLTFESDDKLDRVSFFEKLEQFLEVERDYVYGSLVIAVNGSFGSGKTTFFEMWESELNKRSETEIDNDESTVPVPIVLNAWESDFCGEPLIPILSELINAADRISENTPAEKSAFIDSARNIGWFCTGLGNELVAKFTGLNLISASELSDKKSDRRKPKTPDFIETYKQRVNALAQLKTHLRRVFGGDKTRVIVFVDELDRCRPDYAVSYLETIKHVFDVTGMVFLLGIDFHQLASSTRALFGSELNFDEYFRKFVHRTVELPIPTETAYETLTRMYVDKYLEVEGKRICSLGSSRRKNIAELAIGLKMTPRQLQEAFRSVGHASSTSNSELRGKIPWCLGASLVLLSFLRVCKRQTYDDLKDQRLDTKEVIAVFNEVCGHSNSTDWWLRVYFSGTLDDSAQQQFADHNITNQHFEGWGYGMHKFRDAFLKLENFTTFG
jgi:hypothetical protein